MSQYLLRAAADLL